MKDRRDETYRNLVPVILAVSLACNANPLGSTPGVGGDGLDQNIFDDVTDTNLPIGILGGLSMDAEVADLDGDGDLDIVIANEFGSNILLLNDGSGSFSDASDLLPSASHDSEDIGIADFDTDGDLDIIVVSEDDQINELYFNTGTEFIDEGDRIPVTGISNSVAVIDVDNDGDLDVLVGNNGQNVVLINDGTGTFFDETDLRLPDIIDTTQDIELGDVDGDGDLDLLVGNEIGNRLLINDGTGSFTDESGGRIPYRVSAEETREADFGDIDGDGDLDIVFANTRFSIPQADRQNRLLVNDGTGLFTDETEDRLPENQDLSFEVDFIDVDADGDLDIVTGNMGVVSAAYRVYTNDGGGFFEDATEALLPMSAVGQGFDVEAADFNGDGLLDLFLVSRGSGDRLLLGVPVP
jgi:hypothetical protein